VVWDEHDEGLQNESSPTWHARDVAVERARRAGVPCLLVSPCPTVEARALAVPSGGVIVPSRADERVGWARLEVLDRRDEDVGRSGLYSSALVAAVREVARAGERVVCVLNRTGRARLLACRSCGTVARCERCEAAVHLTDELDLVCGRCGTRRPSICLHCGSTALSLLRLGVTRAREELEALAMEPVRAVTASGAEGDDEDRGVDESERARILIGTEAVLHRVPDAGLVAFLDLDQELLAPRYRAAEEALHLLVMASRLVGGRTRSGRVVVQTRLPDHEVVQAALHADPSLVAGAEEDRRELLGFPPAATIAVVGGEAAEAYVERFGHPLGVEVRGPEEGRWMLRSEDRAVLLDHLAEVERPPGRLRLWVDPARIR
jgi:primosomal protein N' (replication factor Y)